MKRSDLEVYILVGDRRLHEYGVVVDAWLRLSSCWIASEEGQEFAVIVRNSSHMYEYVVKLFIDGREMDYAVVQRSTAKRLAGTYVSAAELRSFKFVKLNLTSEDPDDTALLSGNAPVDLESLGKIELQGWRITSGVKHDWNRNHFDQREIGPVNERSKKAASHVVGLGNKVQVPTTRTVDIKYIDPPDMPGLSFRFLYRSSAILQAQDIIRAPSLPQTANRVAPSLPHSTPPLRLPYERPEHPPPNAHPSTSEAEKHEEDTRRSYQMHWQQNQSSQAEVQKRLETINTGMEALKARVRETEAQKAGPGGRVKQEAQPTRLPPRDVKEVIDLTMDSDEEQS